MHQASPLPLPTQQGGAGYARGAAARAWLLRTLRPATCDVRTRIALLPMHHSGIGSSLLVWASYALLCVEHGYTVVPHGTWKFAKGLEPATHESFFEPLASPACTAEASRRVAAADAAKAAAGARRGKGGRGPPNASTAAAAAGALVGVLDVSTALVFAMQLAAAKPPPTLRLLMYHPPRHTKADISLRGAHARLPRTRAFTRHAGLGLVEVFAQLVSLLCVPRAWVAAAARMQLTPILLGVDAAVHVRAGTDLAFLDRCKGQHCARGVVPRGHGVELYKYLAEVAALRAVRIYVASDVADMAQKLQHAAGAAVAAPIMFIARRVALAVQVEAAERAVKGMRPESVQRLTLDAILDMQVLVGAPSFVGCDSSWRTIVLLRRLAEVGAGMDILGSQAQAKLPIPRVCTTLLPI